MAIVFAQRTTRATRNDGSMIIFFLFSSPTCRQSNAKRGETESNLNPQTGVSFFKVLIFINSFRLNSELHWSKDVCFRWETGEEIDRARGSEGESKRFTIREFPKRTAGAFEKCSMTDAVRHNEWDENEMRKNNTECSRWTGNENRHETIAYYVEISYSRDISKVHSTQGYAQVESANNQTAWKE